MKKIYCLISLLCLSVCALAQDGKSLYMKYSDLEGIQAVYVSPAMFRLIGRIPEVEVSDTDVDLVPLIRSLSGFYLLTSENGRTGDELKSEVDRLVHKGRYELLMEAKEDGEAVRLYTVGDDKFITSFVMLSRDAEETTFICLDGKMVREDFEKVVAGAAK